MLAQRALVVEEVAGETGVAGVQGNNDGGDGFTFDFLDFTKVGEEALQVAGEFYRCHLNVLVLLEGGFVAFTEVGEELANFFFFVNEDPGPGADDFFAGLEEGGGVLAEEGFAFGFV